MVSVLLAAFNGMPYVKEQLATLGAQEAELRVLWQDDGSCDGTAEYLCVVSARDSRFCPGRMQGLHLGAAGNFLSLLQQDDAPCTALCDQDDLWHPGKLRRSLAALQEAEAAFGADTPLLVHHDCRVVDARGAAVHPSFLRHQGWDPAANTLPQLLVQNNVTGCTCVMNAALRRLVSEHMQPETVFMHDWFIAQTAAAFGRIVYVDAPLVDYRQHGRNVLGASRQGLLRRGLAALRTPERAKERIRLTYGQARAFRDAFGDALPAGAAAIVDGYLATQSMPKMQRIAALKRGGYLMQSRVARTGQLLFG